MKRKPRTVRRFKESDMGSIINDRFLEIQSEDGLKFKSLQTYHNVVTVKIGNQTFVITITDKEKLS